jgi:hypothetical protein
VLTEVGPVEVEVPRDRDGSGELLPAEEDVGCGLHQALSCDDALAVVTERALADEALKDGGLGLLRLQEQRIRAVPTEHPHVPGSRTDGRR